MHSHDPEYPDDNWNLYAMIDREGTTALNVIKPEHTIGVFKPHVLKLNDLPEIISDADEEIIVVIRFTSPVHIRKLMVIGGGGEDTSHYPSSMKCYPNHTDIDFSNVSSFRSAQDFNLQVNDTGTIELITVLQSFTNVTSLTLYFPTNYGAGNTIIRYIGMQGEHTHYRREAVNTVYEVLCSGQDIHQPEDQLGAHGTHMH
jgi:hypothetical protein